MSKKSPLAPALRKLAAERVGVHPDAATLVAYHERSMDDSAREEVQAHLALCPRCMRTVLDMALFPNVTGIDDGSVAAVTEEDLIATKLRAGISGTKSNQGLVSTIRKPGSWVRAPQLLAAVFALLTIGLSFFSYWQSQNLDRQTQEIALLRSGPALRSPGSDHSFEILSLMPVDDETSRGDTLDLPSVLATQGESLPVILNFYAKDQGDYRAELLDANHEILEQWGPLRPTSKKNFTLSLPLDLRRPGSYEIRLLRGTELQALFRYRVD